MIGISGEDVVAGTSGRVIVVPGGPNGLRAAGARTWSQATPGVRDDPEPDDRFRRGPRGSGSMTGRGLLTVALAVVALSLVDGSGAPARAAVGAARPSDFNGDGRVDLAIGVPGETVGASGRHAGAVSVLVGGPEGVTASGDQLWSQDSPAGCRARARAGRVRAIGSATSSAPPSPPRTSTPTASPTSRSGPPYDRLHQVGPRIGTVTVLYGTRRGLSGKR